MCNLYFPSSGLIVVRNLWKSVRWLRNWSLETRIDIHRLRIPRDILSSLLFFFIICWKKVCYVYGAHWRDVLVFRFILYFKIIYFQINLLLVEVKLNFFRAGVKKWLVSPVRQEFSSPDMPPPPSHITPLCSPRDLTRVIFPHLQGQEV